MRAVSSTSARACFVGTVLRYAFSLRAEVHSAKSKTGASASSVASMALQRLIAARLTRTGKSSAITKLASRQYRVRS